MGAHALLSASGSHRWLSCIPSAVLEQNFPDETSPYAAEGTAAHALAEHKLRLFLGIPTKPPISEYDSPEMDEYTDVYVAFACELIAEARVKSPDAMVLIEQKLDFSHYVPGGFGTGDLVVAIDGVLHIADLKYGKGVAVAVEHNPQLMLYALGALEAFDFLFDIKSVRMTICQPRLDSLSTCELSVDELIAWAESELKPKAELAIKGEGEFAPGEDTCKFCRARRSCRARTEANLELARLDFKQPPLLTDEEIAEVLSQAAELSAWAEDVKNYALTEAVSHGRAWPGFKVVEGKANRKYKSEAKIAEILLATGQYRESDIYTKDLLGITAMKKLLGAKQFDSLLSDFIVKPAGKPTLVPSTDKRPARNRIDIASKDFD